MGEIAAEYYSVLLFLTIAIGLCIVILGASFLLVRQKPDAAKNSPYECGFDPFTKEPGRFDIRFYLVAILFIIFDLEVAFLFPWAVTLGETLIPGFFSMIIFLGMLTIGFIYEWRKGALDWE